MHTYMYTYIYIHINTHEHTADCMVACQQSVDLHVILYVYMYVHTYVCMYVCRHVCMYVCICVYGCMSACMDVCMHACRQACIYIICDTSMCILYMYVHELCTHVSNTHVCMHMYTYEFAWQSKWLLEPSGHGGVSQPNPDCTAWRQVQPVTPKCRTNHS